MGIMILKVEMNYYLTSCGTNNIEPMDSTELVVLMNLIEIVY